MKKLLRPAQVSELLGVTVQTLRAWDRCGKLHTVRTIGGHRRIPASEVCRLRALSQQCHNTNLRIRQNI
ncbi:MAG: MerR family DNA-binding transcriptional regulator [Rhodopirellula sp.]|nr:MerR family DNA-binding transcriptional regulator [Rhodopirellula sp.]